MRILLPLVVALWSVIAFAEPHPSLPPPVIPECLGVNIHFTDPKPGELEMLAAAGFKWVRMDLGWAATERKMGEYDFSAYDRLVAALDQHKLRALFILDYGNPLYADPGDKHPFTSRAGTDEFRAAYAAWAAAAVTHFQKRGYLWELWNEPNHQGFWKPQPDPAQYAPLALAAAKAIRAAAPGEAIIGPATSTIDLAFLEKCFQAGLLDYLDAVSVHPYRQTPPDSVVDEYRRLRLLIGRYAPKDRVIPIVSGEWGYSTAWKNFAATESDAEEKQAKYVARAFLTNMANDVALSIWYDWRDDGDNPAEPEHRFGLVRRNYHEGRHPVFDPKPAYVAVKTLTGQLAGFRFNKRLASYWFGIRATVSYNWLDGPIFLLFGDQKMQRLAFWSPGKTGTINISPGEIIFEPKPRWSLAQADPEDRERMARMSKESPYLACSSDTVTYARFEGPNELLSLAAASERPPLEVVAPIQDKYPVSWRFRNTTARWLDVAPGAFTHRPEEWRSLGPGKEFLFERTATIRARDWPHEYHFGISIKVGKGDVSHIFVPTLMVPSDLVRVTIPPPLGQIVSVEYSVDPGQVLPDVKELTLRADYAGATPWNVSPKGRVISDPAAGKATLVFNIGDLPPNASLRLFARAGGRGEAAAEFVAVQSKLLHKARVTTDGDAGVESHHEFSWGPAPDGLPAGGQPAARLKYRFGAGWKFLQVAPTVPEDAMLPGMPEKPSLTLPGTPEKLGMMLHGDGRGAQWRVRFRDTTGQVFQADGPKIDWQGWRFVMAPLTATLEKPLAHWGGSNDGVVHHPIQWDAIFLLDNVSRAPLEGEIYFCAPTLIYLPKRL